MHAKKIGLSLFPNPCKTDYGPHGDIKTIGFLLSLKRIWLGNYGAVGGKQDPTFVVYYFIEMVSTDSNERVI